MVTPILTSNKKFKKFLQKALGIPEMARELKIEFVYNGFVSVECKFLAHMDDDIKKLLEEMGDDSVK